jgi:hypothetical protein
VTRILLLAAALLGILWLASRAHDEPVAAWREDDDGVPPMFV